MPRMTATRFAFPDRMGCRPRRPANLHAIERDGWVHFCRSTGTEASDGTERRWPGASRSARRKSWGYSTGAGITRYPAIRPFDAPCARGSNAGLSSTTRWSTSESRSSTTRRPGQLVRCGIPDRLSSHPTRSHPAGRHRPSICTEDTGWTHTRFRAAGTGSAPCGRPGHQSGCLTGLPRGKKRSSPPGANIGATIPTRAHERILIRTEAPTAELASIC